MQCMPQPTMTSNLVYSLSTASANLRIHKPCQSRFHVLYSCADTYKPSSRFFFYASCFYRLGLNHWERQQARAFLIHCNTKQYWRRLSCAADPNRVSVWHCQSPCQNSSNAAAHTSRARKTDWPKVEQSPPIRKHGQKATFLAGGHLISDGQAQDCTKRYAA